MSLTQQITKEGLVITHPTGVRQTLRVADIDAEMVRIDEQLAGLEAQKQAYQTSKSDVETKIQLEISETTK